MEFYKHIIYILFSIILDYTQSGIFVIFTVLFSCLQIQISVRGHGMAGNVGKTRLVELPPWRPAHCTSTFTLIRHAAVVSGNLCLNWTFITYLPNKYNGCSKEVRLFWGQTSCLKKLCLTYGRRSLDLIWKKPSVIFLVYDT